MQKSGFIFLWLLLMAMYGLSAQEFFEGSIHYQVDLEGKAAGQIKLNEPNDQITMHLKDGDYIVRLYGGKYPKLFLFVADSNYEYSMDMANQRAYRFSPFSDQSKATAKQNPLAKPTGKQMEISGKTCDEYLLKKEGIIFLYYVHDAYRVDLSAFPEKCRAKAAFLANGLEGRIPLKTIKKQPGFTVTTTAIKLEAREFQKAQFEIPPTFEVKNRDYRY